MSNKQRLSEDIKQLRQQSERVLELSGEIKQLRQQSEKVKELSGEIKQLRQQKAELEGDYDELLDVVETQENIIEELKQEYHEVINYKTNTLPKHIIQEFEDLYILSGVKQDCPICLEKIQQGNLIITFCGHKYCQKCFKGLNECALCRQKLSHKAVNLNN